MNLCRSCSKDFASMASFDSHRIGPHSGDRRCLRTDELEELGYVQNASGRWHDAAKSEQARTYFESASLSFTGAP